jgi:hypothetical protein
MNATTVAAGPTVGAGAAKQKRNVAGGGDKESSGGTGTGTGGEKETDTHKGGVEHVVYTRMCIAVAGMSVLVESTPVVAITDTDDDGR